MTTLASIVYPHIDPTVFEIGPLHVRWYGLAYLLGFVLCYLALRRMITAGVLRITREGLTDVLTWLILGVFVGGRLGWWIFYHHNMHDVEPWYEPIAVWHGGMSFHGGAIGVSLAMIFWSLKHRAPLGNLADCAALVVPMGLFFGRIANFINAELVGRQTSVAWGMIFPNDVVPRHPSQLYEALLEGPLLLACLWLARRVFHPREGRIAALFLVFYGLFRFAVEFTRQPDKQLGYIAFGWLTMGQILSAAIVVVGVGLWVFVGRRGEATKTPAKAHA